MKKYFLRPNLYITLSDDKGMIPFDQATLTVIARLFEEEMLIPHLQKWSKSKSFLQELDRLESSGAGLNWTFSNLTDVMKSRKT
jgi:hypothetical protein